MKKLIVTTLTLLTSGAAFALPLGNPSEASLFLNGVWCGPTECDPCDSCFSWCNAWSFRIGFYGDYVFNRNLELKGSGLGQGKVIDETTIFTNSGYLVLNFCDRFDFFATLGASTIEINQNETSWTTFITGLGPEGTLSTLSFDTDFSWSVGARASIWECRCFTVGIEGQYFRTTPDFDSYQRLNTGQIFYFNEGNNTTYSEWQVGLGASYAITTMCPAFAFIPYVGVKWAGCRFDTHNFSFTLPGLTNPLTIFDMEEHKYWGYAVGVTFTLCEMAGVTVEGRFADEKALYVNGQFRF